MSNILKVFIFISFIFCWPLAHADVETKEPVYISSQIAAPSNPMRNFPMNELESIKRDIEQEYTKDRNARRIILLTLIVVLIIFALKYNEKQ